jgi:hypothetical protein
MASLSQDMELRSCEDLASVVSSQITLAKAATKVPLYMQLYGSAPGVSMFYVEC